MDRDRVLGLLALVLIVQALVLCLNPSAQEMYARLQSLESELAKSKPTRFLRIGVTLEFTNKVSDSLFVNSLLLVVAHSAEGTEALLISRVGVYRNKLEVIKFGGPVDVSMQFYLHDNKRIANCSKVVDGVYFGGEVKRSNEVNTRILTFSGIMRWGPGELEAEIAQGFWRVGPLARAEYVFRELRSV